MFGQNLEFFCQNLKVFFVKRHKRLKRHKRHKRHKRVLTKKPRINPINSTESDEFKYEKTDTELIREAEAFLFGNHSQYGVISYPGIDIDIPKTTIIDNLNKFNGFKIKIVISGTNEAHAPKFQDIRAIALA